MKMYLTAFLLIELVLLSACNSKAKVQLENFDRTAMQEKISTLDKDGESAARYKSLSAKLNEIERTKLNELIDIIADRTPSKADKKATLDRVLIALLEISDSSLRPQILSATESLINIARVLDASIKNIIDSLRNTPEQRKFDFLGQMETFTAAVSADSGIISQTDSALSGMNVDAIPAVAEGSAKLPSEASQRIEFLKILFKFSPATSNADLNSLLDRAVDPSIHSAIIQGPSSLTSTDENLSVFARLQNSLPSASLDDFAKMTANYTQLNNSSVIKSALTEAIKKALVLKESLRPAFITEVNTTLKSTDSQIIFNALVDSIDRTSGQAYFGLVKFTSRYLKPAAEPVCLLKGSATNKVTYAFRWSVGGTPLSGWSTPSSIAQSSAGSTFPQNTEVQCSVRIFVDGNQVNELNTDLATVRSSAPTFTSGDPPQEQTFTGKKGEPFVYIVAVQDNVPDPNTFYQVSTQPQHGVVSQPESGTFEYKPVPSFVGSDSFSFLACNSENICSSEKIIKLTVNDGNQSPRLESLTAPTWNTVTGGIRMSRDSTLNNIQLVINEDNHIDSSCGIPNVMVLSGDTGKFPQTTTNIEVSGTFPYCKLKLSPAAGSGGLGTTTMTLKLDDQVNPQVLSTFNVTVIEKDPQWATPSTPVIYNVNKNSGAHTLQLNAATDPDSTLFSTPETLSYVIVSGPAIGTIGGASAVPATGNGTITYTTPTGQPSSQPDQTTNFTYKVCDNASPQNCSSDKTITVNIINNAPVISEIGNQIINEDSSTTVIPVTIADADETRTCNDFETNGLKNSSNTALIPLSGIVIAGTAPNCTIQITPVPEGSGGPVTITLGLIHTTNVMRTFNVTVLLLNDAPTLASGPTPSAVNEDTPLTVTLGQAQDIDNGSTLTYHISTPPTNGTLSALSPTTTTPSGVTTLNGTVTYTPLANYYGNDSFSYRVCDQQQLCSTSVNTVTLTISSLNDAPVITASTATTTLIRVSESGPAATITLADGTDADGETLVKKVEVLPAQGSLSGSPTPTVNSELSSPLTYTPALGHTGIFEFVYKICDINNACILNPKVFIEVLSRTPVFNGSTTSPSTLNIAENASATPIALSGATDPDGALLSQTLSYTVELEKNLGTTSNLSAVPGTGSGSVDFTPTASTAGVEILKYKVCDNAGTPNCTPYKYITVNIGTPDHPILMTAGDSQAINTSNFVLGRFEDVADPSANLVYVYDDSSTVNDVTPTNLNPKSFANADRTVTYSNNGIGIETFKYKVCRADISGNPDVNKCSIDYSVVLITQ